MFSGMNKDAIVATLIGFGVGLVVTGLVLYGPSLTKSIKIPHVAFPKISFSLPNWFSKPTPAPTPQPTGLKDHAVIIESPLPEALEQEETLLVSGTTSSDATTVIASGSDEIIIKANGEGKYAGKITLVEGKNDIMVTSFDTKGKSATQTVTVYYTPEEL